MEQAAKKSPILKVLQKTISDNPDENVVRVIREDATIEFVSMKDYEKEMSKSKEDA